MTQAVPIIDNATSIIDKLAWTPVEDKRLLFVRSHGQTLFYCAGGKRKLGETDEDALMREVLEELSVDLRPKSIWHVNTFIGPAHGGGMMQMTCYDADYFGDLIPSNEVAEIAWFNSNDGHRTTEMGRTILDWFKEQDLID